MKCPVCKTPILNNESTCQHCGFTDLSREFINRQDAQDWEIHVVAPYREKWEKGLLGADAWLNRLYECVAFHSEIEKEKATKLTLNTEEDLVTDNPMSFQSLFVGEYNGDFDNVIATHLSKFRNIEKIFFSFKFNGHIHSDAMNQVIHSCPNLVEINFNGSVDCELLTRIDLSKIEKLHVTLKNSFSPTTLYAPVLKSLQITGCMMGIKKKDAKKIQRSQHDLSGFPALENLEIKYCSDFDYRSLSVLPRLQTLRIYDECPINLLWLSDEFNLETLSVYGKLCSLDGIESQVNLRTLDLRHNSITNISKIGYLHKLENLDLGFNEITDIDVLGNLRYMKFIDLTNNSNIDENYLRGLKIPTTIYTKLDKELYAIKQMFTGNVLGTFPGDVCYWIKSRETKDINTVPPYMGKVILKWREKEYPERVKDAVQAIFESKYYDLCNGRCCSIRTVEKQHKQTYIDTALQLYPFLHLTRDMQTDMSNP